LKEEKTLSQIASEYETHTNVISRWRDQALAALPGVFSEQLAQELATKEAAREKECPACHFLPSSVALRVIAMAGERIPLIAEIFAHVVGLGDIQRDIVYTAIFEAYKAHGFRDDLDLLATNLTYPTLSEVLQRIENIAQARHSQNVVALRETKAANSPQQTRGEDHGKAWRLTLTDSGVGWRLHYWQIPTTQGSMIEFANIVKK
jgi:hypothetical protein